MSKWIGHPYNLFKRNNYISPKQISWVLPVKESIVGPVWKHPSPSTFRSEGVIIWCLSICSNSDKCLAPLSRPVIKLCILQTIFLLQEKFRLRTRFLIQECIFVPPRLLCLLGSHLQTPDDNSLSPLLLCIPIFGMQAYSSEYFWHPLILIKQFTSALTPGNPGFSTVHFDLIWNFPNLRNSCVPSKTHIFSNLTTAYPVQWRSQPEGPWNWRLPWFMEDNYIPHSNFELGQIITTWLTSWRTL